MKALATIFFSLVAIVASLVLVLSALCASSRFANDQDRHVFTLIALVALIVVIASMWKIAILNRKPRLGESDPQIPPYSTVPPTAQSSPTPSGDVPRVSAPGVPSEVPSHPVQRRIIPDLAHLSPASQTAIQQLALAIAAKIAAEIVLGLVGWYLALTPPRASFALFNFGFLALGLAALAPDLILLYSFARRPGPIAFAYALVIPAFHILFGLTGHSALLVLIPSSGHAAVPLLSILPWILDILVPYLAWKAIRLTGIRPDPAQLITASVVVLIYRILLPALVVLLH